MKSLTERAKATILLCSRLGLPDSADKALKPYTAVGWNELGYKIVNSEFKVPEALFQKSVEELKEKLFISQNEAERIKGLLSYGGNLAFVLDHYAQQGIYVVTKSDAEYPKNLLEKLKKKMIPPVIFYCGNLDLANMPGVAMVGSRNIDTAGLKYTEELAQNAVKNGAAVISGGARGVDQASVNAALQAGGKAIAFLAADMQKYIRVKQFRQCIEAGSLLVLSEVLPTMGFKAFNAMARNKYIYALSHAAFVIASDKNKGGTWAGAMESMQHCIAPVYVQPSEKYPGNQALITNGALPIPSAIDWQALLQAKAKETKASSYKEISLFAPAEEVAMINESSTVNEKIQDETDDFENKPSISFDIFKVVWPVILSILTEPRSESEIIECLERSSTIVKKQVKLWLDRAVAEGLAEKKGRPVKYYALR